MKEITTFKRPLVSRICLLLMKAEMQKQNRWTLWALQNLIPWTSKKMIFRSIIKDPGVIIIYLKVGSRYHPKRIGLIMDLVHCKTMLDQFLKGSSKHRRICLTVSSGKLTIVLIYFRKRTSFWWNIMRVSRWSQTWVSLTSTQLIPPNKISINSRPCHINRKRNNSRNIIPKTKNKDQ